MTSRITALSEHASTIACTLQTLEGAQGIRGMALLDSLDEILAFAKQVLNKTHLAWSVHTGGGNSYKCSLYAKSNAAQMCTTEVDMLKAALLSSKFHMLVFGDMTACPCVTCPCKTSQCDHCQPPVRHISEYGMLALLAIVQLRYCILKLACDVAHSSGRVLCRSEL